MVTRGFVLNSVMKLACELRAVISLRAFGRHVTWFQFQTLVANRFECRVFVGMVTALYYFRSRCVNHWQ